MSRESTDFTDLEAPDRSIEIIDGMSCGGSLEFMSLATESLLCNYDREKALELLKKNAMKVGQEFGSFLLSKSKNRDYDAGESLALFDSLLEIDTHPDPDSPEEIKIVKSCPFTDSIPEVCQQVVAFKIGMLMVIDLEATLSYGQKGEPCSYHIEWEESASSERLSEQTRSDLMSSLKATLKTRLVRGEITKEEYLDLLRTIQE